nr:cytochrome P450 9e2-like [Onthophagus taurus]
MLCLILFVLLVILLLIKLSKTYSYWTERGVKQRKQTYLLGDNGKVFLKKESFFDMITSIYNAFPEERYIGMYQGLLPTLVIKDPDLIKNIAIKDFDHFTDHQQVIPNGIDDVWAKNLLTLKGDYWRQMRATLSPSFTSVKMKMMFTLIAETLKFYEDYLKKRDHTKSIELKDFFTRFTNDAIATVAFGLKCDSINNKDNEFYLMGKDATNFGLKRNLAVFTYLIMPKIATFFNIKIFPTKITNFFKNLINKTIRMREENDIIRPDMIHLLLEAKKDGFELSDETITSQAVIFFFAGFESVATLLTFMGYELAINPEVQEKLQKEIDETLKECENRNLTYDALTKMKYLDMVINETLRKWPTLATDRVCTKHYKIEPIQNEKEIIIQPGDVVWLPIAAIQRDPKYFENPDKFDPERFNEKNKEKIKPFTYFPFGLGPRTCIGSRLALLEAKIAFFNILKDFNFVPCEKTEIPLKISKDSFGFVPQNGLWIDIKPR